MARVWMVNIGKRRKKCENVEVCKYGNIKTTRPEAVMLLAPNYLKTLFYGLPP
jgi:hypothetical protein